MQIIYYEVETRKLQGESMNHHILAKLHFFGQPLGRKGPILGPLFSCPFIMPSDEAFDGCIDVTSFGKIEPGINYESVPIAFYSPELVIPQLKEGMLFHLWEGKITGYGMVQQILR